MYYCTAIYHKYAKEDNDIGQSYLFQELDAILDDYTFILRNEDTNEIISVSWDEFEVKDVMYNYCFLYTRIILVLNKIDFEFTRSIKYLGTTARCNYISSISDDKLLYRINLMHTGSYMHVLYSFIHPDDNDITVDDNTIFIDYGINNGDYRVACCVEDVKKFLAEYAKRALLG